MKIKNIKFIELNDLELKTFTEQDAIDYCQINNINSDSIKELWLNDNELTDNISFKKFRIF